MSRVLSRLSLSGILYLPSWMSLYKVAVLSSSKGRNPHSKAYSSTPILHRSACKQLSYCKTLQHFYTPGVETRVTCFEEDTRSCLRTSFGIIVTEFPNFEIRIWGYKLQISGLSVDYPNNSISIEHSKATILQNGKSGQ